MSFEDLGSRLILYAWSIICNFKFQKWLLNNKWSRIVCRGGVIGLGLQDLTHNNTSQHFYMCFYKALHIAPTIIPPPPPPQCRLYCIRHVVHMIAAWMVHIQSFLVCKGYIIPCAKVTLEPP